MSYGRSYDSVACSSMTHARITISVLLRCGNCSRSRGIRIHQTAISTSNGIAARAYVYITTITRNRLAAFFSLDESNASKVIRFALCGASLSRIGCSLQRHCRSLRKTIQTLGKRRNLIFLYVE